MMNRSIPHGGALINLYVLSARGDKMKTATNITWQDSTITKKRTERTEWT
jgi:hypothetical protein